MSPRAWLVTNKTQCCFDRAFSIVKDVQACSDRSPLSPQTRKFLWFMVTYIRYGLWENTWVVRFRPTVLADYFCPGLRRRRWLWLATSRYQSTAAGPTVWNSPPNYLRNPAVGRDHFRRDLNPIMSKLVVPNSWITQICKNKSYLLSRSVL